MTTQTQPEIVNVPTDLLCPYPRNSRKHSAEQIAKIVTSIQEFGFLAPCVIGSDNVIIAGHARVQAAKIIGLETVPCVVADHLTVAQQKAYCLIDNRLTEVGEWDREILKCELADLVTNAPFIDLPLMGFSFEEIASLNLACQVGEMSLDPAPPKPKSGDSKSKIHKCPTCGEVFED